MWMALWWDMCVDRERNSDIQEISMQGQCKVHCSSCTQVASRLQRPRLSQTGLHKDVSIQKRGRKFVGCAVSSEEGPAVGTDLLGAPLKDLSKGSSKQADSVDDVELESEAGVDYTGLQAALKAEEFQKADDITREMVIVLAGDDAKARGWVYFSEVQFMPEKDLQTMDKLWRAASSGKFGFSAQRQLFLQKRKQWTKFFQEIDWVVGENNDYRKWPKGFIYTLEAKAGHLPLTNCLRGTQLFESIMMHPAFGGPKDVK